MINQDHSRAPVNCLAISDATRRRIHAGEDHSRLQEAVLDDALAIAHPNNKRTAEKIALFIRLAPHVGNSFIDNGSLRYDPSSTVGQLVVMTEEARNAARAVRTINRGARYADGIDDLSRSKKVTLNTRLAGADPLLKSLLAAIDCKAGNQSFAAVLLAGDTNRAMQTLENVDFVFSGPISNLISEEIARQAGQLMKDLDKRDVLLKKIVSLHHANIASMLSMADRTIEAERGRKR